MVYVALLRGINVGGANKVDMKELKAAFESAGMTSVRTYINSGNVVFSAEAGERARLMPLLEEAVRERFGLEAGVLVRDIDEIGSIVAAIPAGWTDDEAMKCDVFFLWDDVDSPSVLDELPAKPEIDEVLYTPGAVIRRVDRKDAARSGVTKVVGTPLYKRMTVRNVNTARKVLEIMEG